MEETFQILVKRLYIRPAGSNRSRAALNAGTTTMFMELEDSSKHPELQELLDRYPFHQHGWRARISHFKFQESDYIRRLKPTACNDCDNFTTTINTRRRNIQQQSEQRRNAYLKTTPTTEGFKAATPTAIRPTAATSTFTTPTTSKVEQLLSPYRPAGSSPSPPIQIIKCNICKVDTDREVVISPLITKQGKPACQHTYCPTCFNRLSVHRPTTTYTWDGYAMVSVDFKQRGATEIVWVCPLCKV